ncbi:MAG: crossover junction endodeoxyribonuclease RuvC [Gammaproteobacteria bacterium]|nr:MAG: crossover junction endodeoxyribonuclease RuvC [Gammaproteobacteria bacterium]
MTRILGIDPGSRITGFGIIETRGHTSLYVTSGCIRVPPGDIPSRLKVIFSEVTDLIAAHQPDEIAIETVFMNRNVDSALKLGQAQGAAICAAVMQSLPVAEYTPAQIKQGIAGKGNAEKHQVLHMVKALLALQGEPQADAADALAVALCHSHLRHSGYGRAVAGAAQGRWS